MLGLDHSITLWTAGALSHALVERGDAEPGRSLAADTLQRSRRIGGPDHPITVSAAALTLALTGLGEAEPARALGQDTLQRCRRVLGPEHPITQYLTQGMRTGHLLPLPEEGAAEDHPSRPL